jgi:GNAT superfamily N-acetyltransferase
MNILSIGPADEKKLATLFAACFSASPWNEPWTASSAAARIGPMIRTESFCGVMAIEKDEPVGMAFGQVEAWVEGSLFLLQEMCVAPARQNSGVGKAMLHTLAGKLSAEHKVSAMYLLTDEANPAAKFYGKLRFARSARKIVMGGSVKAIIEATQHSSPVNSVGKNCRTLT